MSNEPASPFVAKDADEILRELMEHVVAGVVVIDHESHTRTGLGPYTMTCGSPDISDGQLLSISRVWGEKNGSFKEFTEIVDFTVDLGNNQLTFSSGQDPDDSTDFYVSYRYDQKKTSGITDVSTGSVTRTLLDAVARQVASAYRSLELVKAAAFIDTAEGEDLDDLLALVGMTRNEATVASGYVSFYLNTPAGSTLTVPVNTLVAADTLEGRITYGTTETVSFATGYSSVRAPVSALTNFAGTESNMAANRITKLISSVGVDRVNNPAYYQDYEFIDLVSGNYGYSLSFEPRRLISSASWFAASGYDKGFIAVASGGGKDTSFSTSNWTTSNVTMTEDDPEEGYVKCVASTTVSAYISRDFPVLDFMQERYGYVFIRARGTQGDTFGLTYDGTQVEGTVWGSSSSTTACVLSADWQFYGFYLGSAITDPGPKAVIEYRSDPPASPVNDRWYVVKDPGSGGWNANTNDFATTTNSGTDWSFTTASDGDRIYAINDSQGMNYNATSSEWQNISTLTVKVDLFTTNAVWLDVLFGGKWLRETTVDAFDKCRVNYTGKRVDLFYNSDTESAFNHVNNTDEFDGDDGDGRVDELFIDYEWNNHVSGGGEEEDDDALRLRGRTALSVSAKGTKDAIRSAVLDVDGVTQCEVMDYNDDPEIPPGECWVFVLASGFTVSPSMGQDIVNAIDDVRAAGIYCKVFAPLVRYTNFTLNIVYDDSLQEYLGTAGQATLEALVNSAIDDFFAGATINEPLYFSELYGFIIKEVKGVLAVYVEWDGATTPEYVDDDINGTYTWDSTVVASDPLRISGIKDDATIVVQKGNSLQLILLRGSAYR